jgi:Flp pilus assembly protein TadD
MTRAAAAAFALLLACTPLSADEPIAQAAVDRAWAAWSRGDVGGALAESGRAVALPGAGALAWKVRAYLLSRGGRKDEAAEAYRRAVSLAPSDPVALSNLGAVLLDLGRLEEALEACRRAVALSPGYADARNNLGAVLERMGRVPEAVGSYRAAASTESGHAAALNNLGAISLRRGYVESAAHAFERARALDATLLAPTPNLALLPPSGGRVEATDLGPVRRQADDPAVPAAVRVKALCALAAHEERAERWEAARALYLRAHALAPEDVSVLNNLAVAEDRLGLDREAMLHLEAALTEDPDLLVARNNVGIVHVHRGDLDLAADVFRELSERSPRFHRAFYNLGVVRAAQGRLEEATTAMERAQALAPTDAAVRYDLTLLRAKRGASPADERRGYEAALVLDPDLAEAHLALGGLLADPSTPPDVRDERRARDHLTRFLALAKPSDREGRAEAQAWLAWLTPRAGGTSTTQRSSR